MTPRKQAAAHIRAALKSTFPTTRFVVRRTATTSGCDFYNIRWTGEPSEDRVRQLASELDSDRVVIDHLHRGDT
jgi:hypothetical protein